LIRTNTIKKEDNCADKCILMWIIILHIITIKKNSINQMGVGMRTQNMFRYDMTTYCLLKAR